MFQPGPHQPHGDADELDDVSVGHGNHLSDHGVKDGDAGRHQDGHLHSQTHHHAHTGAWGTTVTRSGLT